MNKLSAFVFMDLYTLKPYLKGVLFTMAIGIVLGFLLKAVLIPVLMAILCFVLIASYPFAIAEKNNMDVFYSVLPVETKNVIAGRYLSALAVLAVCMIITFIEALIISAVFSPEVNFGETARQFLIFISVSALILSFEYPVYFKFGYAKAKFTAMLPMLLLSVAIAVLGTVFPGSLDAVLSSMDNTALLIALPLSSAALLFLSVLVSKKLYETREA